VPEQLAERFTAIITFGQRTRLSSIAASWTIAMPRAFSGVIT
jgi:hypothetical protein